jgi:hypothetical protein
MIGRDHGDWEVQDFSEIRFVALDAAVIIPTGEQKKSSVSSSSYGTAGIGLIHLDGPMELSSEKALPPNLAFLQSPSYLRVMCNTGCCRS